HSQNPTTPPYTQPPKKPPQIHNPRTHYPHLPKHHNPPDTIHKTLHNPPPYPQPPQKTTTNPQPSHSLPTPPQKTTTNPQPSHSLPTPPQKTTTNPQPSPLITHTSPKNTTKSKPCTHPTPPQKTTTNPQPSHSSTLLTPAPFSSIGIHFPRRKRQTSSPQYSHSLPTPQMPHILDSQRYMQYRITQPYEDAPFFPTVAHRFLTSFYSGITPSIASPHITANTNFP
ncbi:hypothetical protein HNY73_011654, partial [Argiope bruennichi]